MPYQLSEINAGLKADPKGYLEACDAAYQQRIEAAADRVLERMKQSPIVLLSGPSGSGKTTTALKLEQELERRGVNTHTVSMDNYFKTLDRRAAPRTPEGDIDYESPRLLDMDLLDDTFTKLSRGEWVIVPHFEFARQMRNDSRGTPLKLDKNEIAIFEGITPLNDDIFGRHPEATGLYISARSNVLEGEALRFKGTWMRISRRAVRDYNFRGTDLLETLMMWYNVRRGRRPTSPPSRAGPTSSSTPPCPTSRRCSPTTPTPWARRWTRCRRTTPATKSSTTWWMPSATSRRWTPPWCRRSP